MQKHEEDNIDSSIARSFTFLEKLVIFFDLSLLKDFSYLNIMVGITLANFAELNFSILTPFVLSDLGFEKSQIALCMSLLGTADIVCRFMVPLMANKSSLENRTFFLIGVCNMALGRISKKMFFSDFLTFKFVAFF